MPRKSGGRVIIVGFLSILFLAHFKRTNCLEREDWHLLAGIATHPKGVKMDVKPSPSSPKNTRVDGKGLGLDIIPGVLLRYPRTRSSSSS